MSDERYSEMASKPAYDNTGILFKNHDKAGERERDYKGEATIAGVKYWVSGWIKTGKNGSKFLTFSFKPKDTPKPAARKPAAAQSSGGAPFNDDLPFMSAR